MKTIRVPLFDLMSSRSNNTGQDYLIKNAYVDTLQDTKSSQFLKKDRNFIKKRPAIVESDYTTTGISVTSSYVTGFYYWAKTSTRPLLFLGVDDKLYCYDNATSSPNDVNSGARFGTAGGGTNWLNFSELTKRYCMIMKGTAGRTDVAVDRNNGVLYYADADAATAGTVSIVSDADLPNGSLAAGIAILNGYCFVTDETTNRIYHSDLNAPNTWNPNNYITAFNSLKDTAVYTTRFLNYVVVFGKYSTQFFEDVGNTSGSVLKLVKELTLPLGCANARSLVNFQDSIYWLGMQKSGKMGIYKLSTNLEVTKISSNELDYYLSSDAHNFLYSIGTRAMPFIFRGQMFYLIRIPQVVADGDTATYTTFAIDTKNQLPSIWTLYDTSTASEKSFLDTISFSCYGESSWSAPVIDGYFLKPLYVGPCNGASTIAEDRITAAALKIFEVSDTTYKDTGINASSVIKYKIQTALIDFNTESNKFIRRVSVVGDTPTSAANFTVRYSDDDYQNWSTSNTIDLNSKNFLTNQGRTKRRAYEIASEANVPIRLEYLEFAVDGGSYGL